MNLTACIKEYPCCGIVFNELSYVHYSVLLFGLCLKVGNFASELFFSSFGNFLRKSFLLLLSLILLI